MPSIWNVTDLDAFERELAAERAAAAAPRRPAKRASPARPAPLSPVEQARQEGRSQARADGAEVVRMCIAAGRPDMVSVLAGKTRKEAQAALDGAMWDTAFARARSGRPKSNVDQGRR
jgi:hypothetical protein